MRLRWLLVLAGGMILGSACAAPPDDESDEELEVSSSPIKGGYTDTTDSSVVGIYDFQHGGLCSGSLIAPNLVLTARHCVSNISTSGGVSCGQTTASNPFSPSAFGVTLKADMFSTKSSEWFEVQEVVITPSDNKLCGQDEAMLILKTNVPAEQATPLTPRVDSALVGGEVYSAVGFGLTSDAAQNSSGLRRRRDNLVVDCAETECKGVAAYVKESEWIGDTGICSGDSGGPALDTAFRVVGVTSRGGANCTSPVYGSVHSWGSWIQETAIHAAELGQYEAPPWATGWPTDPSYNLPVGEACDEVECSICYNNLCTRFCNEQSPCDSGYECKALDDTQSVCAEKPKKKKKASSGETTTTTGCSMSTGADPTNPVPWIVSVGALAVFAARRRRRA